MCTYIPLGPEAHVFEFFNFDNCTTNTPASTTNFLPTFKCDLSQQLAAAAAAVAFAEFAAGGAAAGATISRANFFDKLLQQYILLFSPWLFALALGATKVFYMPTDSWYLHARSINVAAFPQPPHHHHPPYFSRCLFVWVCGKTFLTCKYKSQRGRGFAQPLLFIHPPTHTPTHTHSANSVLFALHTFQVACVKKRKKNELLSCFNAFAAYVAGAGASAGKIGKGVGDCGWQYEREPP